MTRILLSLVLVFGAAAASADQVFLPPDEFLRQTFGGTPPTPQVLWLDDATQTKLRAIFGHNYPQARLRYWRAGGKTAWILEDIGKEFPITAGFVVGPSALDAAKVLVYRETRGDEIRYAAFLKQFNGAKLAGDRLQPEVDGISGATLSAHAMQRMARAALTLDPLATP